MATMSYKLRRRPSTSAVPPLPRNPNWRDWADMSKRVASRIGRHALANDVADYLNFRAAYASWRDHTEDPKNHSVLDQRFHPRRWILLPRESSSDDSRSWRRMLNLSRGTKITVELPHLLGHDVAAGSGGSPGGVLVLIHQQTLVVRLLNPLTGQRIDLPSVASVLNRRRNGRLDKAFPTLCIVTGAGFAGDSTVVLHFGHDNRLVSTKLGGDRWEIVSDDSIVCSAFPFYGKVYFANWDGLMVVDAKAAPPKLVLAARWPQPPTLITLVHMADSSGELMVVTNRASFQNGSTAYMVEFEIFRLDADAGALVPVTDLGERAVFVGDYGGGLVVSANAIVPNAIYFQHDHLNKFYVRRVSDDYTWLLTDAQKGSFVDNLTSYVAWNGGKYKTQVALVVQ